MGVGHLRLLMVGATILPTTGPQTGRGSGLGLGWSAELTAGSRQSSATPEVPVQPDIGSSR